MVTLFKMFDKIHTFDSTSYLLQKFGQQKTGRRFQPCSFRYSYLDARVIASIDVPYLANFIKILMSHGLGIFIYILIRRIYNVI